MSIHRLQPIYVGIEQIASGLAYDLHPLERPFWANLNNVEFQSSRIRRVKTSLSEQALGANAARGLVQLQTSTGTRRTYAGTGSTLYGREGATVTPTSGFTADKMWSFQEWGNWMVASNGFDPLQVAKDSLAFAPLVGTTFTFAEILFKYATFMLAANVQNGPQTIRWCNFDNVEDWATGLGKSGGGLVIREATGPIRAAVPLGQEHAILTDTQLFRIRFIGAPAWFGLTPGVIRGVGAVGKNAVCTDGGMLYGLSRRGIWRSDGISHEYIDLKPGAEIRDWLQANISWQNAWKVSCRVNDLLNSIEFLLPINATECNKILSYCMDKGSWSLRDMNASVFASRYFDYPISIQNGTLFEDDKGTAALTATAISKPFAVTGTGAEAYIDGIQHFVKNASGLQWRLGAQVDLTSPIVWSNWQTAEEDMKFEPLRLNGTYFTLELSSTSAGVWEYSGFLLYGRVDGTSRGRLS